MEQKDVEKQVIAEMRKDLIEIFDEEYEKRRLITPDFTAEKMTAKGYRKQREGEWIWKDFRGDGSYALCCSECLETDGARETVNFCPNCGAMMKGGAE